MTKNETKKILIIEDEAPLRKILVNKLKLEGYDVFGAETGEEGRKILLKEEIDLLLLDLILPGIPGEQVLKEIRENKKMAKLPVIVLTAKGNDANIQNCLDTLNATDYLVKSKNSLESIVKKIKKIIGE